MNIIIVKENLMTYNKNYKPSTNERETPWELYNLLDDEFGFVADMAATPMNTKHHSLAIDWPQEPVFLNPPYSTQLLRRFVAKAREEALKGCHPVLLLPVSTSSKWWFQSVVPREETLVTELRFLTPRVPFLVNGRPILNKSGKPVG